MTTQPIHSHTIRVRYAETDQMGVAHHAVFPVWFEIGRTEYCRDQGIPYGKIEEAGYLLRVARVECRFLAPLLYDQEAQIDTWVERLRSRNILFRYTITRQADKVRIADGHSLHICTDRSGNPAALPDSIKQQLLPQAL